MHAAFDNLSNFEKVSQVTIFLFCWIWLNDVHSLSVISQSANDKVDLSSVEKDEIGRMPVSQLKKILARNFVDYRGCVEKRELVDRVLRLWEEYHPSPPNSQGMPDSSPLCWLVEFAKKCFTSLLCIPKHDWLSLAPQQKNDATYSIQQCDPTKVLLDGVQVSLTEHDERGDLPW